MALGPFGPTVYSVARTLRVVSGCVEPSESWIVAVVPCGKKRVA